MCIVGAGLCVQFQAHGQPSVVYRAFDESFGTQFHQIVVGKILPLMLVSILGTYIIWKTANHQLPKLIVLFIDY